MNQKIRLFLKAVLVIVFLPFLIFLGINTSKSLKETSSWWMFLGMGVYSFLYIFFLDFKFIFSLNKKITEKIFIFFSPFIRVAYFIAPLFIILTSLIFLIVGLLWKELNLGFFLFLMGFLFSLHVILSCRSIRPQRQAYLDINYLFGFLFILLLSTTIFLVCLKPFFKDLSLVSIFKGALTDYKNLVVDIYEQLFVPKAQLKG